LQSNLKLNPLVTGRKANKHNQEIFAQHNLNLIHILTLIKSIDLWKKIKAAFWMTSYINNIIKVPMDKDKQLNIFRQRVDQDPTSGQTYPLST